MEEFGVLMRMSARPQTKPRCWWGNGGEVIGVVEGFAEEGGSVCSILNNFLFYTITKQSYYANPRKSVVQIITSRTIAEHGRLASYILYL